MFLRNYWIWYVNKRLYFWSLPAHFKTLTSPRNTHLHCWHLQVELVNYLCVLNYDFIHFSSGWPRWETEPSVIQHLLIGPLSAAYWSSIKHATFLPARRSYTLRGIHYAKSSTEVSAENNRDLSHTHRISAKPAVLKIFIRIHFLMELLNLPKSRSPETTAGWLTV